MRLLLEGILERACSSMLQFFHLGAIFDHVGADLAPSWGHLGAFLGPSWGHLGASWGRLEVVLEPSGVTLWRLGATTRL